MRAIVIGAGASGMTAALTAARLGHSVMLIERQARVGRKLMATGNGRCNLTNTGASPEHYHGADVCFMRTAMEKLPPESMSAWRMLLSSREVRMNAMSRGPGSNSSLRRI